jgi:selenophosphate synthase
MAVVATEVVADLLGGGTKPEDLRGYVVIGLTANGFKIASNASDAGEIVILTRVLGELRRAAGDVL